MDSNFRTFWLAPFTRNILGHSLFCERREKWGVVSLKFQEKNWRSVFYPSDLVNTKTTIPLRVGEERWIYTETLVSVYIHHYSPPLRGIVVYYCIRDYTYHSVNLDCSYLLDSLVIMDSAIQPLNNLLSRQIELGTCSTISFKSKLVF